MSDQIDLIRHFLDLLQQQFYRWGYILGWIGVWEQVRSRFVRPVFLVLIGACVAFFAMNYGRGRDNAQRIRIPEEYILEPLPYLPGMARIIGKQTEEGILWAERQDTAIRVEVVYAYRFSLVCATRSARRF